MSAEIRRDILELEKLRQEIESDLAKRHNWAEQERFWRANADFWAQETRLNRGRNYIAVAAIAATVAATITAVMGRLL